MILLLVVFLTLLWLLAFPMSVGFLAAVLEKRLVWPYAPLESLQGAGPAGPRDAENPFAAPGSDNPLPTTDYAEVTNTRALQLGFSPLGAFHNVTSKLYRVRSNFWLSPDRSVFAVVSTGTLAAIPLNLTSLVTRTGEGRCLLTVDDFKGSDSDPSGLSQDEVLTNADFEELLARHTERVAASNHRAEPYPPDDPLEEHRRFRQFRAGQLEERGFIRFLDDERERWKYTVRGAAVAAFRSTLRQYLQRFSNRGRKTIPRPGEPGYVLSGQRSKRRGLPGVLGKAEFLFWIMLGISTTLTLTADQPKTPGQALFRTAVAVIGLGGLVITYIFKYLVK
jgi:hypothetical protein